MNSEDPNITQIIDTDGKRSTIVIGHEKVNWTISSMINGSGDTSSVELYANTTESFRAKLNKIENRYRIDDLFASGGFGDIYRAYDKVLGRVVVVKSLRKDALIKDDTVRKFIAEAKLNAQLDHPSIVPLYSLDSDAESGLHLAMKLVDGITLKEYLERLLINYRIAKINSAEERKSLEIRLEYFLHICDAVSYSHSRNICHCDLKPENIMVGRYAEVYVMDWGCAAPIGTCRKGHIEGTPAYMAPEVPHTGETEVAGDIFSLGMILFELVTLSRGVNGDDSKEILRNIAAGRLNPVRHSCGKFHISGGLVAIVNKARARKPGDRYATVKDLAGDVRSYLFNEDVAAKPDGILKKCARAMYNHRAKTFIALLLVFCSLAVLAAYGLYRENIAEDQANRTTLLRLSVQRATELQADNLDSRLLAAREQLKFFANSLLLPKIGENGAEENRIYLNSDFKNKDTKPEGMIATDIFRNKINLTHPAYYLDETLYRTERKLYSAQIVLARKLLWNMLQFGVRIDDTEQAATLDCCKYFLQHGGLSRRISLIFPNGCALRYPGMYENITVNDFMPDDVKDARSRKPNEYLWSLPRTDTTLHYIVSCWGEVNDNGKSLGSVGLDICFSELIKPLYIDQFGHLPGSTYYLLTTDGRIIFSSHDQRFRTHFHYEQSNAEQLLSLRNFPFPVFDKMKNSDSRQLECDLNGRRYLISWSPLPTTGWMLVQVIEMSKLNNMVTPGNLTPGTAVTEVVL